MYGQERNWNRCIDISKLYLSLEYEQKQVDPLGTLELFSHFHHYSLYFPLKEENEAKFPVLLVAYSL